MTSDKGALPPSRISVIVPAYNAPDYLRRSLPPLIAMRERGEVREVIVADDEFTDNSKEVAAALGARVVSNPRRGGPGAARNFAAKEAVGDILWFVDADVIAHAGGARIIEAAFEDETVVAVHGLYDDAPPAGNFASQYKNLTHRFYHQRGKREASTFWAGLGAVRKSRFLAIGGFDVTRFIRPSVEDIDLGYRLRAAGGRILLLHDLEGTHLKHWTLSNVVFTDIFRRAIPWARLMLTRDGLTDDLNVATSERLRAGFAGVFFLSLFAPLFSLFWLPCALFAGALAINWRLFAFFRRRRGLGFALLGLFYHQIYYIYSMAAFVWCVLELKLFRTRDPRAA